METAVVLDSGSISCRVGFVGEETPTSTFKSLLATPLKAHVGVFSADGNEVYVGDDAVQKRKLGYRACYPINAGIISEWDRIENLWDYAFSKKLEIDTKDHPIILTDAANNVARAREKIAEIMFERFNFPEIYIGNRALFSLFASNRTTGLVLQSGFSSTLAVPIYNGETLKDNIYTTTTSGQDITDNFMKLLTFKGYNFCTSMEREIVRNMKETHGYIASNYEKELENPSVPTFDYELPDGQLIPIGDERFKSANILFKSELKMPLGIHDIIFNSISKCPNDLHENLYRNIVLSGGSTSFPGLTERLKTELQDICPPFPIEIDDSLDKVNSAWKGASLFGTKAGSNLFFSRYDYDEYGASFVHDKFNVLKTNSSGKSARK